MEMTRIVKQKAIDNEAERARIQQEQKEEDMANITKERENLSFIQDRRLKSMDRRERMLKELDQLRKEREIILQAQSKIAKEEVDVKRRRKQQVNALTVTTQLNNEFNAKTIREFGDPDVVHGGKTRLLIEEQRAEVLRLLKIVMKLRNNLVKQNKVVVELRTKVDDRRHLGAMMEQRVDIQASRKVLQSQRRKVIESKKKLREIIQNIVIEKRQNERQFRENEESREDRESLGLQLQFDQQTYEKNCSAHENLMVDTNEKDDLLQERQHRLESDRGILEQNREDLKETTNLVTQLSNFLKEDREGTKKNITTMRETVQKLTSKIKQSLTPGGEQQPEPDPEQPCFVITSAGSNQVNGTYCRAKDPSLTADGAIEFYMKSLMGLFVMVYEADDGTWWISMRDTEMGDNDYYYAEGEFNELPTRGWMIFPESAEPGRDPLPHIETHEDYRPAEGMGVVKEDKTDAQRQADEIANKYNMLDLMDDEPSDTDEESSKPLIDPKLPLIEQTRIRREMLHERVTDELVQVDKAMAVVKEQTEYNQNDAADLNTQLSDFRTKFMEAVKARDDFEEKINDLEKKCENLEEEYVVLKKRRTVMMFKKLADKARRNRDRKIKQAADRAAAEKSTTVVDQCDDDDLEDDLLDLMFHHSADPTIELAYHLGPYFDRYRTETDKHLSYKLNFAGVVYSFLEGVATDIRGAAKDLIGFGISAFQELEKKKIAGGLLITSAGDPVELRRRAKLAEEAGNMPEAERLRTEANQAEEAADTAAAFDKFDLGDDFDEEEAMNFNLDDPNAIEEKGFDQIMGLIAFQRAKQKEKESEIAADIAEYSLDEAPAAVIDAVAVDDDSDDMAEFADLMDW